MSKIWDEREKNLEEEYFRRKEQEVLEKLRAKRTEKEQRKKLETPVVHCPKCGGTLAEISYEGVQIDHCNQCRGVWLDAGELEQLMKQGESHGWLSRMWLSLTGE